MQVNLLPAAMQTRLLRRRCLRAWAVVWSALGVLIAGVAGYQWRQASRLESRHTMLATACEPLRQLQAETARLTAEREIKIRDLSALEKLASDGRALRLLGILSQQRSAAGDAFQLQTIVTTPRIAAATPGANPKPPGKAPVIPVQQPWQISLTGVAESDAAINQLVAALRAARCFGRVELKSIVNSPATASPQRDWTIELDY